MPPIGKVAIYATSPKGLLVFTEPDFPDVPFQVPGGTIEPGEQPCAAAQREFTEETGLAVTGHYHLFAEQKVTLPRPNGPQAMHRYCFQTDLPADLPHTWDHIEALPSDGSAPILFRYSWLSLDQANVSLGSGMEIPLPALERHLRDVPTNGLSPTGEDTDP